MKCCECGKTLKDDKNYGLDKYPICDECGAKIIEEERMAEAREIQAEIKAMEECD